MRIFTRIPNYTVYRFLRMQNLRWVISLISVQKYLFKNNNIKITTRSTDVVLYILWRSIIIYEKIWESMQLASNLANRQRRI